MNLELSLSQLLFRYQCVTVPGFGAFLTETISAQWEESTNSFYPPSKIVSFNSYIKTNDGLLATHIAQSSKISYDSAVQLIEIEVFSWKNKLQNNETLTLKTIGDLVINQEHNLVFTPSQKVNYNTQSFGLTSFVSPVVKRTVFSPEPEETAKVIEFSSKKSNALLKYAAVFILTTGTILPIGYTLYQDKIKADTLVVEQAVQRKIERKIQQATFEISNPIPDVTIVVPNEKKYYHIVAGAFKEVSNAENAVKELVEKGFEARKIEPNKHGLIPVLYGSFATYQEAKKALTTIQKTENADAWLLIQEF